jgi:ketosteroid isomerase-like protein
LISICVNLWHSLTDLKTENMSVKTITEIIETARIALETRNFEGFINLFAEEGVFEMPFGLKGPERLVGTEALRKHFGAGTEAGKMLEIHQVKATVYPASDPNIATVEFTATGRSLATGQQFDIPSSIAVIKCENGRIVNYHDYPNTMAISKLAGRNTQLAAALAK